jgi:hypothetical protein
MKRRSRSSIHDFQTMGAILQPVRHVTALIPRRWRGAVLLAGTILLFPFIVCVMILEAVTRDGAPHSEMERSGL